jgi:H+/Cl- antiporter ClcA
LNFIGIKDVIRYRGLYSIVGATALTSSVTRTLSPALIVLELNGHFSHAVPVLISSVTSYIVSDLINP